MILGRRKLNSYFRSSRLSQRNHVYAFFFSFVVLVVLELYGIRILRDIGERISGLEDVPRDVLLPIYDLLNRAALLFFAGLLTYTFFAIFFLVTIEQKVGGATVALLAYIEQLRAGNLDYKRKLREGDEFKSVMEALHALAKEMKDKQQP
jgi:hypothetical protein